MESAAEQKDTAELRKEDRITMMVTEYDGTRTLLVLQIDHSRVAGWLAAHWGNATFARPEPYASMVIAAGNHDMGWWNWEIRPTLGPDGRPIDYVGSAGKTAGWHDWYRHGIQRVAEQDRYAGLIVLLHGMGLTNGGFGYLPRMPDRKGDPENDAFIAEGESLRQQMVAELSASDATRRYVEDETLWRNYKLMQVFDQLGQFICNRYPFNSRARRNGPPNVLEHVPVAPGVPDVTLTIDVLDEQRAIVRPYPFDINPLPVTFPARLVPNRPFASQEEFLDHYYRAEQVVINYTLLAD